MSLLYNFFRHKYPYTNLHELDLSWILDEVGDCRAAVEEFAKIIEKFADYVDRFDEFDEALKKLQNDFAILEKAVEKANSDIILLKSTTEYHTSQIQYILQQLQLLEVDYESILKIVDAKIRQSEAAYDVKLSVVVAEMHESNATLEYQLKLLKTNLNGLIVSLDERVTRLENNSGLSGVYNPLIGSRLPLDENNSHVYVDCARLTEAKDVEVFEANLTDGEINALNLTDYEASLFGGIYFFRRERVFSPVTGTRVSIHNALSQLAGLIFNSATDETINDLNQSDSYFNDLDLTDLEFNQYQF